MTVFGRRHQEPTTTVDLRDPAPAPKLEFGFPTPCPNCGAPGYVEGISVATHTMFEKCRSCATSWSVTEEELAGQPG